MKKLNRGSIALFGLSLVLFISANFLSFGNMPVGGAGKKVRSCSCLKGNIVASYGNTCITGSGSCVSNPCPSGTSSLCVN